MPPEYDVMMRMASSILRRWRDLRERERECRQPPGTRMRMGVADTIRERAANQLDGKSVGIVSAMRGPIHRQFSEQLSAPNRVQP